MRPSGDSKAAVTGGGRPPAARPWKRVAFPIIGVALAFGAFWYANHRRAESDLRDAQAAADRRDFAEAGRRLDAFLTKHPGHLPALALAAQVARRGEQYGHFSERLREYEQKNGPGDLAALERTRARVQQGDVSDAEAVWVTCRDRPTDPESQLTLEALIEGGVRVLIEQFLAEMAGRGEIRAADFRRAEQAVSLWEERADRPADRAQGLIWRGKLAGVSRRHSAAQEHFRGALAVAPDHFAARLDLAALLVQDNPEEAAAHLEVLRGRDPANPRVGTLLAAAWRGLGRPEEAGRLLDELLAADPGNIALLLDRARAALDARRPELAVTLVDRVLDAAPDHPDAHLVHSQCDQLLGRPEVAKRHLDRRRDLEASERSRPAPTAPKYTARGHD